MTSCWQLKQQLGCERCENELQSRREGEEGRKEEGSKNKSREEVWREGTFGRTEQVKMEDWERKGRKEQGRNEGKWRTEREDGRD